jgi:hypothetical protein
MFYALALEEESYFAWAVEKFIALAPCTVMYLPLPNYEQFFQELEDAEVYAIYGPDWKNDYARLCDKENPALACKKYEDYRAMPQPISVKDLKLSAQQAFAQRF